MTKKRACAFIAGIVAVAGALLWKTQQTPYERCWTDACRDREGANEIYAELAVINAKYAEPERLAKEKADESMRRFLEASEQLRQLEADIQDVTRRGPPQEPAMIQTQ